MKTKLEWNVNDEGIARADVEEGHFLIMINDHGFGKFWATWHGKNGYVHELGHFATFDDSKGECQQQYDGTEFKS